MKVTQIILSIQLGNRLYRYEFVDGRLINPVLLLDLTAIPPNARGEHNGGKIRIGPDDNVYLIVGEVGGHRTQAQNVFDGPDSKWTWRRTLELVKMVES